MTDQEAIDALVGDLQWQIDQMRERRIKNNAGHQYNPSFYKRGLEDAIEAGGHAVAEYVKSYLYKAPSGGYQKLEAEGRWTSRARRSSRARARPTSRSFSDEDREAARERLARTVEAIEAARRHAALDRRRPREAARDRGARAPRPRLGAALPPLVSRARHARGSSSGRLLAPDGRRQTATYTR